MSGGREESSDLAQLCRRASSRRLIELVGEHARELTVREVRQILLNPFVTAEAIDELVACRGLLSAYEVRCALARHPRTRATAALRLVSGLYWRDLLEVALDMRLAPSARRAAERYLVERLPRLAVGEKIALARRAGPALLALLRDDPSPSVVRALLGNPRLTEETLIPLVSGRRASPRVLDLVAAEERWGSRYRIRVALSRNPRAPFRVIFSILPTLQRQDLEVVAHAGDHAAIVRHRARELLRAGRRRKGGGRLRAAADQARSARDGGVESSRP